MAEWNIEPLHRGHDRKQFSSGQPALDQFLTTLVSQYHKRGLGRTYVATETGQTRVAGYYTLAAGSFDVSILPEKERQKLPKHPVPTIHLGRLAVDTTFQGKRLGETLLFHALHNAVQISAQLGAFAVDVWAIDDAARKFYVKYGFQALLDDPQHLYLPMKTVMQMFAP
jgi:ribosomal protein S18 acetylase RimI-like enzyme